MKAAFAQDPEAQRIHDTVTAALVSGHQRLNGSVWQDTQALLEEGWLALTPGLETWSFPPGTTPAGTLCVDPLHCDSEFQLRTCEQQQDCAGLGICRPVLATALTPNDVPRSLCVAPGDAMVDRIYSLITKARTSIDITSLLPATGRYRTAIIHGLIYLDNIGARPDVRMLYGNPGDGTITGPTPQAFLSEFVADIQRIKPNFSLPLSLAWLRRTFSFNHAKIIAIDNNEVITGGQNFVAADYLSQNPVYDVSLQFKGTAAATAQRFTDVLWSIPDIQAAVWPPGRAISFHANARPPVPGNVQVVALGRLGDFGDNPSDTALAALIGSARRIIRITQQDLFRVLEARAPLGADALADAVLRGVDVEIIKSHGTPSTVAGYNMVSPENSFDALGRIIERRAGRFNPLRPKGHYISEICERVHLTALRSNEPGPTTSQVPLHGKFIMVDDAAFYVGSHNIYPSNLAEYGNIVFSSAAASLMMQNYWLPAWTHSLAGIVPCRPPLVGG